MRRIMVQAPEGRGQEVLRLAREHDAEGLAVVAGHDGDEALDLVYVHLPNAEVGDFLEAMDGVEGARSVLMPQSVLPLERPGTKVAEYIKNVQMLSPLEVWLNGLQSIGSWTGFLGYAVLAAVVAWVAMLTNSVFLLVAAMILAPFAGPAMNLAVATAAGDLSLAWKSLARYAAALLVTVLVTALLSVVLRQQVATDMMLEIGRISASAALLPLAAGAAAALNLIQAERSSLVGGTVVGVLVAASLAPPSALIGMAGALRMWPLARNGAFQVLLQLALINLSGAIVFHVHGLTPAGSIYKRGERRTMWVSVGLSLALLATLLAWQFSNLPILRRASQEREVRSTIQKVVQENALVRLVDATVRITRDTRDGGQEYLLATVYVAPDGAELETDADVETGIRRAIQMRLTERGFDLPPYIDVTLLTPP